MLSSWFGKRKGSKSDKIKEDKGRHETSKELKYIQFKRLLQKHGFEFESKEWHALFDANITNSKKKTISREKCDDILSNLSEVRKMKESSDEQNDNDSLQQGITLDESESVEDGTAGRPSGHRETIVVVEERELQRIDNIRKSKSFEIFDSDIDGRRRDKNSHVRSTSETLQLDKISKLLQNDPCREYDREAGGRRRQSRERVENRSSQQAHSVAHDRKRPKTTHSKDIPNELRRNETVPRHSASIGPKLDRKRRYNAADLLSRLDIAKDFAKYISDELVLQSAFCQAIKAENKQHGPSELNLCINVTPNNMTRLPTVEERSRVSFSTSVSSNVTPNGTPVVSVADEPINVHRTLEIALHSSPSTSLAPSPMSTPFGTLKSSVASTVGTSSHIENGVLSLHGLAFLIHDLMGDFAVRDLKVRRPEFSEVKVIIDDFRQAMFTRFSCDKFTYEMIKSLPSIILNALDTDGIQQSKKYSMDKLYDRMEQLHQEIQKWSESLGNTLGKIRMATYEDKVVTLPDQIKDVTTIYQDIERTIQNLSDDLTKLENSQLEIEIESDKLRRIVLDKLGIDVSADERKSMSPSKSSVSHPNDDTIQEISLTNTKATSPQTYEREYQTVRKYFFVKPLGFEYMVTSADRILITKVVKDSQADLMKVVSQWEIVEINETRDVQGMLQLMESDDLFGPLLITFRVIV